MRLGIVVGDQLIIAAAVAVVAIVVAALVWIAATAGRRRAKQHALLASLGFRAVTPPPPDVLQKIAALQPERRSERLHLRHLFQRTIPGGNAYLLDLVGEAGGRPMWLGDSTIVVVSPSLALPFVMLRPTLHTGRRVGSTLGNALEKVTALAVARAGLVEVDYPDDIEFGGRFVVIGDNQAEVRGFLTESRRTGLLELPENVVIAAKDDAFAVSTFPPGQTREPTAASIQTLLETTERLLDLFS